MNISTTGLHSRQSVFRPYAKRVATLLTGVAVTMALTIPAPLSLAQVAEDTTPAPIEQVAEKTIVSYSKSGYPVYSDGTTEIPADVTTIGDEEYKGNTDLRVIVLPGTSSNTIGASAFEGCSNLTDVIFPRGNVTIGNSAFSGCTSLRQVALYSSTSIGLNAFQDCTSLTQFAWFSDSSLGTGTSITAWAFSGCTSLREITVPESLNVIAANAFKGCTSLEEIHGLSQEKVEHWKTYAGLFTQSNPRPAATAPFKDLSCYASTSYNDDTITSISNGGYPIYSNGSAYIPNGVTTIGDGAFSRCTELKQVSIPDTATTIGDLAFYGCSNLYQVSIPNGVSTIGGEAFADTGLVYFSDIHGTITSEQLRTFREDNAFSSPFDEEITIDAQPQEVTSTTEATIDVTTTDNRENKQIHIYDSGLTCEINPLIKTVTTQPKAEYDSDTNTFKVANLQPGTQYMAIIGNNAPGCSATNTMVTFITQEETVVPDPTYTVTFDVNEGTLTGSDSIETNADGLIVDWPSNPTRDGYEFDGWFTQDFVQVDSDTVFTEDTTIKAAWMRLVDVTWTNWNDSFIYTDNVRQDATNTLNHPANPTRPEDEDNTYSFKGWSKSEDTNGNITYKATYNAIPKNAVTWLDGYSDDPVITSVKLANGVGYEDKYPSNPMREGYRFIGWSEPNTEGDKTTITAQWVKCINVVWLDWDGNELAKTTVDEGYVPAATTQPDPTRPEANNTIYTFKSWSEETTPNGDVTYKATYNSTEKTKPDPLPEDPKPSDPANPGNTEDPNPGNEDDSGDAVNPSDPVDKGNSNNQGSDKPSDHKPITQDKPEQNQPTKQDPVVQDKATDNTPTNDSSQPNGEESLPPRTSDSASHAPLYMLLAGLVGLVSSVVRKKPTQD